MASRAHHTGFLHFIPLCCVASAWVHHLACSLRGSTCRVLQPLFDSSVHPLLFSVASSSQHSLGNLEGTNSGSRSSDGLRWDGGALGRQRLSPLSQPQPATPAQLQALPNQRPTWPAGGPRNVLMPWRDWRCIKSSRRWANPEGLWAKESLFPFSVHQFTTSLHRASRAQACVQALLPLDDERGGT